MASGGEEKMKTKTKTKDLYAVLGLNKECTASELRDAYKKLALRWHPDRCSASGSSKSVEESKKKFQGIQQAYSVLSDANKRFLYDVGVYNDDDDENLGMGEFLSEMAVMMSQTQSDASGKETLEELQELFDEMFQADIEAFAPNSRTLSPTGCSTSSSTSYISYRTSPSSSNKRSSSEISRVTSGFDAHLQSFCFGTGGAGGRSQDRKEGRRRNCRSNQRQ
ncbi:dnaJ homolog subfamily B member 6-like isoform X2 [Rhodamnia argentea]|uniref:DnaJ homolog subfamily B member 6-like isoform X2 n=1 Tax=Rhodamnia argentea TaxID=178133 RepID=A0ABM3HUW9_9MYRT|nr:dnaJ homolog subfamily B member 6-like isoform X2 [Rhodamnia argentea]